MRWAKVLALLLALSRASSARGDVPMEMLLGAAVQQSGPQASFSLEAYDPKYVIGLALDTQYDDEEFLSTVDDSNAVEIADHNGQKFVCVFPKDVPDGAPEGKELAEKKEKGKHNITELLGPLATGCYYRVDGWWTYEFCHRKSIRQFHQELNIVVAEFFLGHFDGNEGEAAVAADPREAFSEGVSSTGGTQRFYAHNFTNGTECELTGERRSTEVRFVCSPEVQGNGVVESVTEHPTCHYVLNFASSLLCNHSAFTPEPPQVHQIRCKAVGGSRGTAKGGDEAEQGSASAAGQAGTGKGDVVGGSGEVAAVKKRGSGGAGDALDDAGDAGEKGAAHAAEEQRGQQWPWGERQEAEAKAAMAAAGYSQDNSWDDEPDDDL